MADGCPWPDSYHELLNMRETVRAVAVVLVAVLSSAAAATASEDSRRNGEDDDYRHLKTCSLIRSLGIMCTVEEVLSESYQRGTLARDDSSSRRKVTASGRAIQSS